MTTVDLDLPTSAEPTEMSRELDRLQAKIARGLERAGVVVPSAQLAEIAGEILDDAVRVALLWLGDRT